MLRESKSRTRPHCHELPGETIRTNKRKRGDTTKSENGVAEKIGKLGISLGNFDVAWIELM